MLVLAGAGSGKTRVITQRIARLIEGGVRPEQILGVTFTNKAAAEMVERIAALVGAATAQRVWLSTFHSFGVRFLGEESRALGYGKRFVIFDQGDSIGLIRQLLRELRPAERKLDPMALLSRISLWKNAFKGPEEVPELEYEYDAIARELYPRYEKALLNMRAVDFDDLVVKPVRLLQQPEVRARWQARYRYLLVDEFQDTNRSQLELVKALTNELRNICVVGDDDQSIYGWRGAEVGNILGFEDHFPGTKVVKLEDNYRSRAPILEVANAAIAQSRGSRHRKVLRAARGPGERVRICAVADSEAQVRLVVREIRDLAKKGERYRDMAVLYRSNQHAKILEEELRAGGVPYRIYGGTRLFDRKEVKDAVAYLRVVVNPHDELSLRRILNYPARGIGETSVERLSAWASRERKSLEEALGAAAAIEGLSEPAARGAAGLLEILRDARRTLRNGELLSASRRLFEASGLRHELEGDPSPAGRRRVENLEFLLGGIHRFERNERGADTTLAQFLARLTLDNAQEQEVGGDQVTLSSLHSAKGLEFDTVFLIGCVEGQLPHSRTTDPKLTEAQPTDVDEERRLFYVGVTRAKERLFLVYPQRRTTRGRVVPLAPSRFLHGLPEDQLEPYSHVDEAPMSHDELAAMTEALLAKLGG